MKKAAPTTRIEALRELLAFTKRSLLKAAPRSRARAILLADREEIEQQIAEELRKRKK